MKKILIERKNGMILVRVDSGDRFKVLPIFSIEEGEGKIRWAIQCCEKALRNEE